MASWMLLALFLLVPVELCEIPAIHNRLIKSLNLKLLRATEDVSKSPNPSVHVGLRLSKEHNLEKESQYLERLKLAFQPSESSTDMNPQTEASTGQLALYLLALRASCEDIKTEEARKLITRLKHHLHAEKKQIGHTDSGKMAGAGVSGQVILVSCICGNFRRMNSVLLCCKKDCCSAALLPEWKGPDFYLSWSTGAHIGPVS